MRAASIPFHYGNQIALYHPTSQRFLQMSGINQRYCLTRCATSPCPNPAEIDPNQSALRFLVLNAGRGCIALFSLVYQRYLRVDQFNRCFGSPRKTFKIVLSKNGCNCSPSERFILVACGSGVALYNPFHRRFVCCPVYGGASPLRATAEKGEVDDVGRYLARAELLAISHTPAEGVQSCSCCWNSKSGATGI